METEPPNESILVGAGKVDDPEFTQRLRDAVDRAGGPTAVSRSAALSRNTLNTYLAGRDMRRATLVALAKACGVSIEWLATGTEPKLPGEPARATISDASGNQVEVSFHRQAVIEPRGLFETVDINLLSVAFDTIEEALRRSQKQVRTIDRARAIIIVYDLMKGDSNPAEFLADLSKSE